MKCTKCNHFCVFCLYFPGFAVIYSGHCHSNNFLFAQILCEQLKTITKCGWSIKEYSDWIFLQDSENLSIAKSHNI